MAVCQPLTRACTAGPQSRCTASTSRRVQAAPVSPGARLSLEGLLGMLAHQHAKHRVHALPALLHQTLGCRGTGGVAGHPETSRLVKGLSVLPVTHAPCEKRLPEQALPMSLCAPMHLVLPRHTGDKQLHRQATSTQPSAPVAQQSGRAARRAGRHLSGADPAPGQHLADQQLRGLRQLPGAAQGAAGACTHCLSLQQPKKR